MSATTLIEVGPVQVQMQDDGDAIVRMMNNGKIWEPDTRQYWYSLVDTERAVIDVGAYTGIYAIASALLGAKVFALEPHHMNFLRLQSNAAINSVKMTLHEVAASDKCQPMLLQMTRPANRLNDVANVVEVGNALVSPIRSVTIDGLGIAQEIGMIKVDVEGHELKVLHGAVETLHRSMPIVLVECLNKQASLSVHDFMTHCGYRQRGVLDGRNYLYTHTTMAWR